MSGFWLFEFYRHFSRENLVVGQECPESIWSSCVSHSQWSNSWWRDSPWFVSIAWGIRRDDITTSVTPSGTAWSTVEHYRSYLATMIGYVVGHDEVGIRDSRHGNTYHNNTMLSMSNVRGRRWCLSKSQEATEAHGENYQVSPNGPHSSRVARKTNWIMIENHLKCYWRGTRDWKRNPTDSAVAGDELERRPRWPRTSKELAYLTRENQWGVEVRALE